MNKENLIVLALMLGSNALTATAVVLVANVIFKRERAQLWQMHRTAKMNMKAVQKFAQYVDPATAKMVLDELEFDWVVRDLDDLDALDRRGLKK